MGNTDTQGGLGVLFRIIPAIIWESGGTVAIFFPSQWVGFDIVFYALVMRALSNHLIMVTWLPAKGPAIAPNFASNSRLIGPKNLAQTPGFWGDITKVIGTSFGIRSFFLTEYQQIILADDIDDSMQVVGHQGEGP